MSFLIGHKSDYVERAKELLPSRFRGTKRMQAFVAAIGESLQLTEDLAFSALADTTLETATDDALDQWGRLVGLQRLGLKDRHYRQMIKGQVRANLADPVPNDLIEVYEIVTAPSTVEYVKHPPRGYRLTAYRNSFVRDPRRRAIKRIMGDAKPVGSGQTLAEAVPDPVQLSESGDGFDDHLSRVL